MQPNSNSPNPSTFTPLNNEPPKASSKKIVIIVSLIVAAIIAVVLIFFFANQGKKSSDTAQPGGDTSAYIAREGYDFHDGIGDATALTSSPAPRPVSFAGKTVVQPCNIITLKDLRDNGLKLLPNSLTGPVTRTFYDGQGKAAELSTILLPSSEETSSCQYLLIDRGAIELSVLQDFSSTNEAIAYEIRRKYSLLSETNGVKVYQSKRVNSFNKDESTYLLGYGTTAAILRLDIDETKKDTLLKLTVDRFKKQVDTPTPGVTFSYSSPVMSAPVFTDCSMLNDENFKKVMGAEASAVTQESLASAIGVVEDPETKKLFNFSSYDCRRTLPGNLTSYLAIKTQTYETEAAAKMMFALEQTPRAQARNIIKVTPAVGDESYFGDIAAANSAFVFRKGRLIVVATYYVDALGAVKRPPAQKQIDTLRPVFDAAARTIQGF